MLLLWIIEIALGAILGAIVAGAISAGIGLLIEIIKIIFEKEGKKIAILGAGATGKTRLLDFLEDGKFSSSNYLSTLYKEKKENLKVNIGKGEVLIRTTYDISGVQRVDVWFTPEEYRYFDFIYYLFRAPCLLCSSKDGSNCSIAKVIPGLACKGFKDYRNRVKYDLNYLSKIINNTESKVALVGTFCDLIPEFNIYLSKKQLNNFNYLFESKILEIDFEIYNMFKSYKNIFLGSLKNEDYASKLVAIMLQPLIKK